MPGLPLLEGELKLTFTLVEAQQVDGQTYLRINSEGEGQMESPEPSTVRGVAVSMFFEIDHQATTVFCLEAGETQLSTIQDSVRFEATAVNATTGKRVTTTVTITDNATLEKVDKPPK